MAAADTARLVAELTLDDKKFSRGMASANKSVGTLDKTLGKAGQGAKTFGRNLGLIGVAAAGGIAVAVKGGLDNLAELESAISSVDGAIKQMGLTGQVTGAQVAEWANKIESDIGAAFDDKEITAAAATLLRFGKVTPKNLEQTLEVMTDLAVKTGDVESSSNLLAKALADPAKAAGKLSKAGVVLTKQQQEQIKAMTEAGDVAGAQAIILGELEKATKGAAAASQGPYQRSLSILKDVTEDAQKALAVGFLPVITKVADLLSKEIAKPETLNNIRKFGEGLAGGLDSLIGIAQNLPWATIGDSLKIAGAGAQAVLKAFVSLPPWVQTAVITGWGLNKLTGGALGGIVSELGKGLIKGVLGMTAGVVNIKAGTVVGGGGGAPVSGGGTGTVGRVAAVATAATGAVVIATVEEIGAGAQADFAQAIGGSPAFVEIAKNLQVGPLNITGALDRLQRALSGDFRSELEVQQDLQAKANATMAGTLAALGDNTLRTVAATERAEQQATANAAKIAAQFPPVRSEMIGVRQAQQHTTVQLANDSRSERQAIAAASAAQKAAQAKTTEAARQAAFAIRDKDLSVTTNVSVQQRVSVNNLTKAVDTYSRIYRTAS